MDKLKKDYELWRDRDIEFKYELPNIICGSLNFSDIPTFAINNCSLKPKPFNKFEVIINDPAVILIVHHFDPYKPDEKYVAKAYNEKFDPEKGLAICLLKYYDISYPDLKRMIKNAKVQETKEKVKKNKKK